jgi:predicted CoA-binding protein
MTAGYSKTPLVKKLGIKEGFKISILNPPDDYETTLGELPAGVQIVDSLEKSLDFIQFFTREHTVLEHEFANLKNALAQDGSLWISWPKRASKIVTDLDENIIRDIGLAHGLVDVKVAAVDEAWSGLKFVYRVKDRKPPQNLR